MIYRYDVVVIGAGPAGLHAAWAAARHGARVAILDDNPRAGGQIWRHGPAHPPSNALRDVLTRLRGASNVTLWPSTKVIAPLASRELLVESAGDGEGEGVEVVLRGVRIAYDALILATGARERLLPFAGWTLPGVTGAGGLQALIKGGVPVRGERIVIAGSGPLLLAALATARAAGADVVAVVEQASALSVARFGASLIATPSKLLQAAQLARGLIGAGYMTSSIVSEARGDGRVEAVTIQRRARTVTLACERIASGYGLVPNVTLALALGCKLDASHAIAVDAKQRTSVDNVYAAGECAGIGGMELARIEGEIAGQVASVANGSGASQADTLQALIEQRTHWQAFAERIARAFVLKKPALTPPTDATVLCRCEDVTLGEVRSQESWRAARLQTRCGMGACQGRICGDAARTWFGWPESNPRPPFNPAQIGTLIEAKDAEE